MMKNDFFEGLRRISWNLQMGHLKFIYFYRLNYSYIDSAFLLTKIYTYAVRSWFFVDKLSLCVFFFHAEEGIVLN